MVTIVLYSPENVSLVKSALVKRISDFFEDAPEGTVQVRKGAKVTPCVLAVITDSESLAYGHEQADDSGT